MIFCYLEQWQSYIFNCGLNVKILLSASLSCFFYLLCSISSFCDEWQHNTINIMCCTLPRYLTLLRLLVLFFHNHSSNCCAGRHKLLLSCCTDCGGRHREFSCPAEFELSDWIRDCCVRCVPQRSEWRSQRKRDHTWVILKTCHNQHWLLNISKHVLQACVLHDFTVKQSLPTNHMPIFFLNTLYCAILSAPSYIQCLFPNQYFIANVCQSSQKGRTEICRI